MSNLKLINCTRARMTHTKKPAMPTCCKISFHEHFICTDCSIRIMITHNQWKDVRFYIKSQTHQNAYTICYLFVKMF